MEHHLATEFILGFSGLPELPLIDPDNITLARKEMSQRPIPIDPKVTVIEQFIPGPQNAPEVRIKIYKPKAIKNSTPLVYSGFTVEALSLEKSRMKIPSVIIT
jgi:hypothetical protein